MAETCTDVLSQSVGPERNGQESKVSSMGKMLVLGEEKVKIHFGFSPKHSLESENIKCHKVTNQVTQ